MVATRTRMKANQLLAANVRRLRREAGITQVELAEKLHIMQKSVSDIERGAINPRTDTVDRLADFFDVDVTVLFSPAGPA